MNNDSEIVEASRKLLRIIGYDSVSAYFAERLEAGKDLPSRPQVISAYGKVAGADAVPLLKRVACDHGEHSDSRVAAIEALANTGGHDVGEAGTPPQIIPAMIALLDDEDSRVRNASASGLADLGVEEAASDLLRIFEAEELDTLAEKRVRSFLLSSGALCRKPYTNSGRLYRSTARTSNAESGFSGN